ncbi:MAG TPA: hypothetical protein PLA68_18265 [Panacibacter sp.]|nr:hypothetical protein [Panacibacter sp.]
MLLKNYSKRAVITGTAIILIVKFIIRPYVHVPAYAQILVDVMPNLTGSFLLPFAVFLFLKKFMPLECAKDLQITCLSGFLLLVINEYLQLIPVFRRTFDYFDILFSFAGILTGYYVFSKLMFKESLHKTEY